MTAEPQAHMVALGLKANWRQFALLVLINAFVGGMVGQQLARLTMKGTIVVSEETLVPQMGRIRDVRQSPDGYIYLITDDRDGKPTPIYRLEPVERSTAR